MIDSGLSVAVIEFYYPTPNVYRCRIRNIKPSGCERQHRLLNCPRTDIEGVETPDL